MQAAILVVLAVLLLALLIMLALLGLTALGHRRAAAGGAQPQRPPIGSPAQVLLDRGERAARRLDRLGADQPLLSGAVDDAAAVVAELRAAAAKVGVIEQARAGLAVPTLQAQQRRLDQAIANAAGRAVPATEPATEPVTEPATEPVTDPATEPATEPVMEADLRAARESIAGRLATAARHQAARDAVLARMRAAVTGLEQAETELAELLAASSTHAQPGPPPGEATIALQDRLAGLRAGLTELRGLGTLGPHSGQGPAQAADQGLPGDLPGSVEPPPRT